MIFSPHFLGQIAKSNFAEQIRSGVLTIDNSEYATWSSCFTMGLYAGGLRRISARSKAPLAFGGAIHAGLETFFKYRHLPPTEDVEQTRLRDWRAAALADAAVTELDALGDPKRNSDKVIDLLESYILDYSTNRSAQFDILKIDGKPCVEHSFVVPLGTCDVIFEGKKIALQIMWSGKIDLLTRYEGAIAPVDHKTTTVMGEKFVDDKIRGNQMPGYTYAARYIAKELFDLPVFGTRINALAMRSSGYEFKQFDIPFPDWKIAEWQSETIASVASLVAKLDYFLASGQSIPTREHCVTKYGRCSYFDVCDIPANSRDRMIFDESYYCVSEWSPLD